MSVGFDQSIKNLLEEIVSLKTHKTVRSALKMCISKPVTVKTGYYKVTYEERDGPILSKAFCQNTNAELESDNIGFVYNRTPEGNTQTLEVDTYKYDGGNIVDTLELPMVIISNIPVIKVERIG